MTMLGRLSCACAWTGIASVSSVVMATPLTKTAIAPASRGVLAAGGRSEEVSIVPIGFLLIVVFESFSLPLCVVAIKLLARAKPECDTALLPRTDAQG